MIKLLELNSHREGFAWDTNIRHLFYKKSLFRGNLPKENKWYFDRTLKRFRYKEEPLSSLLSSVVSDGEKHCAPSYFYYTARRNRDKEVEVITKEAEEKTKTQSREYFFVSSSAAANIGSHVYQNMRLDTDGSLRTSSYNSNMDSTVINFGSSIEAMEDRIINLEARIASLEQQNHDILRTLDQVYSHMNSSLS